VNQTQAGLVLSQRHQHNNPIIGKFIIAVGGLLDLEVKTKANRDRKTIKIAQKKGSAGLLDFILMQTNNDLIGRIPSEFHHFAYTLPFSLLNFLSK